MWRSSGRRHGSTIPWIASSRVTALNSYESVPGAPAPVGEATSKVASAVDDPVIEITR